MRFYDFDIMRPTLTEKCSSRSSRIVTPLCEREDMMKFFANRCRYSTLHCFITMKITKTWHGRTDFHEKWRFFEGSQTSDKHSENCIESFSPMETLPEARTNFFSHRKSTISTETGCGTLVDQQMDQNWLQIGNLRTLKYKEPSWQKSGVDFFGSKNRENQVPAIYSRYPPPDSPFGPARIQPQRRMLRTMGRLALSTYACAWKRPEAAKITLIF